MLSAQSVRLQCGTWVRFLSFRVRPKDLKFSIYTFWLWRYCYHNKTYLLEYFSAVDDSTLRIGEIVNKENI